jgi:drug/metabolite transporter (DMT)-like permease
MFKKIINHKNFWRSVVTLAFAFALLFCIFKWVIEGFSFEFISREPLVFILSIVVGGFIYGFFVTYGKFWKKFKENQK